MSPTVALDSCVGSKEKSGTCNYRTVDLERRSQCELWTERRGICGETSEVGSEDTGKSPEKRLWGNGKSGGRKK